MYIYIYIYLHICTHIHVDIPLMTLHIHIRIYKNTYTPQHLAHHNTLQIRIDETKCVSIVTAHTSWDFETDSDSDLLTLFLGLQVFFQKQSLI